MHTAFHSMDIDKKLDHLPSLQCFNVQQLAVCSLDTSEVSDGVIKYDLTRFLEKLQISKPRPEEKCFLQHHH